MKSLKLMREPLSLPKSREEPGGKLSKAELHEMFLKMSQDIRLDVYTSVPKIIHRCFHCSCLLVWKRKKKPHFK